MADADYQKEMQKLRDDLAQLRTDVSGLTDTIKDLGTQRAEQFKDSTRAEYRKRREQMREQFGRARERGRDAVNDLEEGLEEHPLGTLIAAFGLGFVIAKLLGSGGDRR